MRRFWCGGAEPYYFEVTEFSEAAYPLKCAGFRMDDFDCRSPIGGIGRAELRPGAPGGLNQSARTCIKSLELVSRAGLRVTGTVSTSPLTSVVPSTDPLSSAHPERSVDYQTE